jgi:hypothetical protein
VKQPRFWVLFGLVAIACGVAARYFFPLAFSILALDVSMDRDRALAEAAAIMAREQLGPAGFQQAASFGLDTDTQTFVELEGGGKPAFTAMLGDGFYAPYAWRVRHFKEGETNETTIRFAPDGRLDGFVETIAESAAGPAIEPAAARALAEQGATGRWHVDLAGYELVEQSQEVRTNGRVDHTLTYERKTPALGDGRYRLRLTVTGDRLTEVSRFVFVPEAFDRRYASMRSANEAIGVGSVVGMALLYVFGGIGIGLFYLLRQRSVIVRPAVKWGIFIAGLQALATINSWPLAWMSYDTALPRSTFIAQQIATAVSMFVGFSAFFALSFMAAESLTRRAFGSHPQLWRSWSPAAGSSTTILGHTVAGYLLVTVFLAYDVGLYLFATRVLGWWSPSETLLHPDALATYVPWLDAIANSLQAGFWEECLFRAVPIAGAALIGDRFGKRTLFIVIAFVVQSLVFGAGHATYPAQPSYARPVELILPSIGFGLIYLYFGLIPGIVLHFAFDVVWFALPIFSATAPGIWVQQLMLIVMTFVPLWVLLWRRAQTGAWTALDPSLRNAAWTPPPPREIVEDDEAAPHYAVSGTTRTAWMAGGAVGLVALVAIAVLGRPDRLVTVSRARAAEIAREAVAARGATLDARWRVMPVPDGGSGGPHEFVARTAGEARRRTLVGTYLPAPGWQVRIASYEGDVAERAEEWRVGISGTGEVGLVSHVLPEGRTGASLDEASARRLAQDAVTARTGLDVAAGQAAEIEARPQKLDARTDWVFTFADRQAPPLPQGELRIQVTIAGDEVTSTGRFVHVPEDWLRSQRASDTRNLIIQVFTTFVFGSLLVAAAGAAVIAWSRHRYAPRLFVAAAGLMLLASGLNSANGLPMTMANLPTAQPLPLQMVVLAGIGVVALTLISVLVGLPIGSAPAKIDGTSRLPDRDALGLGIAVGLAGAGIAAAAAWLRTPIWGRFPDLTAIGAVVPIAHVALAPIGGYLTRLAVLLTVLVAVDRATHGWTRSRASYGVALALIGFLAVGAPGASSVTAWLLAGLLTSVGLLLAYLTALRADLTTIPVALATMAAAGLAASSVTQPFSAAWIGGPLAALLVFALGWQWHRALRSRPA